ncbi:MAG: energy transducer TonB [candidate division Zixibacteria bacterium]|nr:energy transducer TonB [candidate division Zixibacteria bacterium]
MTDVNRSPYPCAAYTLKLTYQRNLFLGLVTSSLLVILLIGYLWLIQVEPTVIIDTGGGEQTSAFSAPIPQTGFEVRSERPHMPSGSAKRRLAGQSKHGFIPVPAVDIVLPDPYTGYGEEWSVFADDSFGGDILSQGTGNGTGSGTGRDDLPGWLADTTTYTIGDHLQRVPELVWMKQPAYPERARRLNLTGTVMLHVLVSRLGNPLEVVIFSESPDQSGFGDAAMAAAASAVFSPAVQNGYPVRCWVAIPLEFAME